MAEPPRFQEASRCNVCQCSFNTFRRRHHCRCCGRTLCNEHSSNQMALPQFGINYNVRVCYDCFNNSTWSEKAQSSHSTEVDDTASSAIKDLNIHDNDSVPSEATITLPSPSFPDCKCGMPLCICEVSLPDTVPVQEYPGTDPAAQLAMRPKKPISTKRSSNSASKDVTVSISKPSLFFSIAQSANGNLDRPRYDYEKDGEGLREAIKSNDITAVKYLLDEGVNANYCDKQGMSLLHLAALFNRTEIVFTLMDHGARVEHKNAQGETPLDCAPTMLQYKMREKMSGGA
ncbi:uncharacterized protein LOC116258133 isoform X2 [Nymphaea colorata]|nr:uncharacterized protein LOC116258133 isoform X2 [Nymphaea colorata]